eukprot:CAMPEP_0172014522 /NCGR_PEP_ID=MMETSP1041-20130122/9978_1 /TAXON_ID=464988 /ORGANISM="Hemiselmis andersenii, Strain CCMP439" /LENGTH=127 /DNA_ID=CAMNT_0012669295 /DNA_START=141 /DNA_END=521 /DNA_ORIENTATION=-
MSSHDGKQVPGVVEKGDRHQGDHAGAKAASQDGGRSTMGSADSAQTASSQQATGGNKAEQGPRTDTQPAPGIYVMKGGGVGYAGPVGGGGGERKKTMRELWEEDMERERNAPRAVLEMGTRRMCEQG